MLNCSSDSRRVHRRRQRQRWRAVVGGFLARWQKTTSTMGVLVVLSPLFRTGSQKGCGGLGLIFQIKNGGNKCKFHLCPL